MDDERLQRAATAAQECKREFEVLRADCREVLAHIERCQRQLADLRAEIEAALRPEDYPRRLRVINGGRA
jgi:hypothetical protein